MVLTMVFEMEPRRSGLIRRSLTGRHVKCVRSCLSHKRKCPCGATTFARGDHVAPRLPCLNEEMAVLSFYFSYDVFDIAACISRNRIHLREHSRTDAFSARGGDTSIVEEEGGVNHIVLVGARNCIWLPPIGIKRLRPFPGSDPVFRQMGKLHVARNSVEHTSRQRRGEMESIDIRNGRLAGTARRLELYGRNETCRPGVALGVYRWRSSVFCQSAYLREMIAATSEKVIPVSKSLLPP